MIIQLPTETWIEILDWLKRRDLINKLDKLWDSQFTPIVQDWLHNHKYTKNVKIGRLAAKAGGGLHLCLVDDKVVKEVPIAEVELPENIVSFERITISRHPLEPEMLTFLHLMRPLFRKVCLDIIDVPIEIQTVVRLFIQLIGDHGQIESLILNFQWLQFLADNYRDALFNARVLQIWYYKDHNELLIDWLFTRREDGQPRTLMFGFNLQFCMRVRERFLDPARQPNIPCPFFIRICGSDVPLPIPLVTENVRTGEQLTIQGVQRDGTFRKLLITNCPLNVDPEWMDRKTAEVLDWNGRKQQRTIFLDFLDAEDED